MASWNREGDGPWKSDDKSRLKSQDTLVTDDQLDTLDAPASTANRLDGPASSL